MALLFAANRWGNGKGIYNYQEQADKLLDNMVHRQPSSAIRSNRAACGHDRATRSTSSTQMILFSPDERQSVHRRSYHLPAFYELWARWGPERDGAFWAKAAAVSRDYFYKVANPETGLTPNYSSFEGHRRLPRPGLGGLPRGCLAVRDELVGRLVLVGQGSAASAS